MNTLKNNYSSNAIEHPYTIDKNSLTIRYYLQEQRAFFNEGNTLNPDFRKKQLLQLKKVVNENKNEILNALHEDLKKPPFEAYLTELAVLFQEIDYAVKNLKKWSKPKKARTPLTLAPASSWITPEPYGQVLIIGPWNYPFQLIFAPLIAAVAAGNVSVIKPSELSPKTSSIIAKITSEAFDPRFVLAVQGGADITQFLLSEKFDYIFFTGGTGIGRIIMEAAAKNLTPVTLELGGKSPVIVNNDASIEAAAKKIAWSKYLNAGQTCIAPDYLLVHSDIKKKLIERIGHYITEFYGENPKESPDYSRMINLKHFKRIKDLTQNGLIITGGQFSEKSLYIAPTIIDRVNLNSPIMKEEIFGPVLPVIEFEDIEKAVEIVKSLPKPLALYLFTSDRKIQKKILSEVSAGGVVINDLMLHAANFHLPFGGVGNSGTGSYHGKYGFETFSHHKAVLKKSLLTDIPFRYPPYKRGMGLLKRFFG